jgi:urease accessory protein
VAIITKIILIITMDKASMPGFPWLARLLQVSDSAFPTGGYAHSYGFEQVVRFGLVRDASSMALYLEEHLWPMLISFELPVVRFAQEAAMKENLPALLELDACVDATKSARELREASRATGRQRLRAFCTAVPSSILDAFGRCVEDDSAKAHHAVIYGIGLASLPQPALLTSWAYQGLNAVCLSAPKLLRMGQDAAQRVLTGSLERMEERVARSLAISREELGWFDPLMELASMQHEIAYERLFIS